MPSRHCPDGHPNPPLADVCRVCGAAIDAAAPTVAILQPVLGRLVLDDGEASAIDRALVLGRRPDAAVAGMPAGSRLIAVGSAATVSRTHAVVRADGWTVTVTDCGSRSGTAVLMPDGDEPLLLQPWIPHEVPVDARIFLGGPTSVSIEASGGAASVTASLDGAPAGGWPDLVVEFVGDERVLTPPGDELTFGRSADLVIDDNRYLHRVLGRFGWANGTWWLSNVGSAIPLAMADTESPSFVRVAPGATVPIPFGSATLGFEAGGRTYELRVEVLSELSGFGLDPADVDVDADGASAELTTTASSLPLTDEQRLLLVALAEPRLRDVPGSEQMPTNRQIAHMFGWTITKFNRKLDGLCIKYAAAGDRRAARLERPARP